VPNNNNNFLGNKCLYDALGNCAKTQKICTTKCLENCAAKTTVRTDKIRTVRTCLLCCTLSLDFCAINDCTTSSKIRTVQPSFNVVPCLDFCVDFKAVRPSKSVQYDLLLMVVLSPRNACQSLPLAVLECVP
jgi:hypothetical protein